MAANKIRIKGRDFDSVQTAITAALGKSNPAEEAVWAFLEDLDKDPLPFLNISSVREEEQDATYLFFPRGVSRDKRLWNGIAGIIHGVWQENDREYDITLELGSRFDQPEQHYFLYTMMLSWLRQSRLSFSREQTGCSLEDIFRFLWVAIFKNRLLRTCENGLYKTYQYFEDNSTRIRGAIDIPRHIRLNLGLNNGKIACKYRENTTDNFLNHLLIHTYLELRKSFPDLVAGVIDRDRDAHACLQALMAQAPSYIKYDVRTVMSKLRRPISHPFFLDYEQMRKLCFQILSYVGISLFEEDRSEDETQCMLFYTPDLWEAFVEDRILPQVGPWLRWQAQVRDKDLDEDEKLQLIVPARPDFVLSRAEGDKRAILDAKYKKLWSHYPKDKSWLREDILQCLAYQAIFWGECCGTVFPVEAAEAREDRKDREPLTKAEKSSTYAPWENFYAFGVAIPAVRKDLNFDRWRTQLEQCEQATAKDLETALEQRL